MNYHDGLPFGRSLKELLEGEILPALFERLDRAFPEFGWKANQRGGWTASNREFTKKEFGARPDRVVCNKPFGFLVHGGEPLSWLAYVNSSVPPQGAQFPEAIRELAKRAGVSFPERELTAAERETVDRENREISLRKSFWAIAREALGGKAGDRARAYLLERGYRKDELSGLPLGLFPSSKTAKADLLAQGFTDADIEASGLFGNPWWAHRIVGAWKDRYGHIRCFWGRLVDEGEGRGPKYLYCGAKVGLYGLDVALSYREGRGDLLVVEGLLDVVHLQARGFFNVAALGGSGSLLSEDRWRALARLGLDRVTLCLDSDDEGQKGLACAISNVWKVREVSNVYVVDTQLLQGHKDPDEFVRAKGLEAFRQAFGQAVHFYSFCAGEILERHKPTDGWTDKSRDAAVSEALELYRKESRPETEERLNRCLINPVIEETGSANLAWHLEEIQRKASERRLEEERERLQTAESRSYEELLKVVDENLTAGHLNAGKELLRSEVRRLYLEERKLRVEPVRSLDEELSLLKTRLKKWRGRDFIGLPQGTLPTLDTATSGLRGLILLAAPPNVGKTALGVQLGVDVVEKNPDACFLFLSLEMPRMDIAARILCRWARMDWKTLTYGSCKGRGRGQDALFTEEELGRLEEAEETFGRLGKRIRILDEVNFPEPTVTKVLEELEDLKSSTGASRAFLLIDYLQVWPIPTEQAQKLRGSLDADDWKIGQMKTLRDQMSDDALMVISETRKPKGGEELWGGEMSDVRGSARISYTPDIVFLFQPWSKEQLAKLWDLYARKGQINYEALKKKMETLRDEGKSYHKLIIAKGRDGVSKETIDLTFWYRQAALEEGVEE